MTPNLVAAKAAAMAAAGPAWRSMPWPEQLAAVAAALDVIRKA